MRRVRGRKVLSAGNPSRDGGSSPIIRIFAVWTPEPRIIREYTPADKADVLRLIRLNTPASFAPAEEADLDEYLEHRRELYYVLLANGTIAGCGGINFADGGTTAKISWDIVHPAWQGRSLGTRLLEYRIEKLESLGGIRRITVRTSRQAHRFYEKRGFVLREVRRDYWAEGFDLYAMEYTGRR